MRRLAVITLLVAALASCGFQEKRERADHIRGAPDRLAEAGAATIRLTTAYRVVSTSAQAGGIPGGRPFEVSLAGELDYRRHRSTGVVAIGEVEEPFVLWDGPVVYQKRLNATTGQQARRPWQRLDVASLYDDRHRNERSAVGSNLVGPAAVVDLVRGVLTGSVEEEGSETLGGVETTQYKVNVDLEKAFADSPTALREGFEAARVITGMSRVVHPARVWLDEEGLPRRVEVRLRQERSRRDQIEVKLVLDILALGAPSVIVIPEDDEVTDVESIGGFEVVPDDVFGGGQQTPILEPPASADQPEEPADEETTP